MKVRKHKEVRTVPAQRQASLLRRILRMKKERDEMLVFKSSKEEHDHEGGKRADVKEIQRMLVRTGPDHQTIQRDRIVVKWTDKMMVRIRKMLDVLSVPAAKVIELYGLNQVPGPTRNISLRTSSFGQRHPRIGYVAEIASWSVIGFDMAFFGAHLSRAISGIGPMLADIIAYTGVMVHPSLVAATIHKAMGVKNKPGMSQYYQACSIADIAATPVSMAVLGGVIHSGSSEHLSVGRAVSAVMLSSVLDYAVWAAGFIPYWAKVIRHERSKGVWKSLKEAGKGFFHPFRKAKADCSYEEAGRIAGIGAVIWAPPVYAMRLAVGALIAMAGIAPSAFNQAYFSITNGVLGLIRYVVSGIKNTLVGRLITRVNGGGDGHSE